MADDAAPTPDNASERRSLSAPYQAPGIEPAKKGNGSGWILAVAILQMLGGIVMWAMSESVGTESVVMLILLMSLALVFFGLWLWGRKSPFPALLTALIVFVSMHLLDAVYDPTTLLRGILMKIVVLVGMSAALKQAYVAKRERELMAAEGAVVE